MTNCIHCDIAERYSNPDTKINNTYDILWVGISAKIGEKPLSEATNTGKLVKQIEAACGKPGYKTNLVNPPRLIRFREYRRGFQTPHELSFMPATLGRSGYLTTDTAQTQ